MGFRLPQLGLRSPTPPESGQKQAPAGTRAKLPALALAVTGLAACTETRTEQPDQQQHWQADRNAQGGFDPSIAYALAPALMLGFQATKLAGLYSKSIRNPWERVRTLTLNDKKTSVEEAYDRFGIANKYYLSTFVGRLCSATGGFMATTVAGLIALTYSTDILANYKAWDSLPQFLLGTSAALSTDVAFYAWRLKKFFGLEKAIRETRENEMFLRAGTAAAKLAKILAMPKEAPIWFKNTDIANKPEVLFDWLFGRDGLLTGKDFFTLSPDHQIAVINRLINVLDIDNPERKKFCGELSKCTASAIKGARLKFFIADFDGAVRPHITKLKNTLHLNTKIEEEIAMCALRGDWDTLLKGLINFPYAGTDGDGYRSGKMAECLWEGLNNHPLPEEDQKRAKILALAKTAGKGAPRLTELVTIIEAIDAKKKLGKIKLPLAFNPIVEVRASNFLFRSGKKIHAEVLGVVNREPPKSNIAVSRFTWQMYFEKNPDQHVELYRAANSETIREAVNLVNYFFNSDDSIPPQTTRQAFEDMLTLIRAMTEVNAKQIRELVVTVGIADLNYIRVWPFPVYTPELYARLSLLATISRKYKTRTLLLVDAVASAFGRNFFNSITDTAANEKTHAENILAMIAECGSFSHLLYAGYITEGKAFLEKHRAIAKDIIDDKLGPDELKSLVTKYSDDYLLFVSQYAIPASSESYVKGGDVITLLNKGIAAGDYRDHVPVKLRDRRFGFSIPVVGFVPKVGVKIDPDGKVQKLYEELVDPVNDIDAARVALVEKIKVGLSEPAKFDRAAIATDFFKIAAAHFGLKEALPRVERMDYNLIAVIEEQLGEKDKLPAFLKAILGDVPDEFFAKETLTIDDPNDLVEKILATAAAAKEHKDKKREQRDFVDLIEAFSLDVLQEKIFSDPKIDVALVQKLRGAKKSRELSPDNARFTLARNILLPASNLMQAEKAKFVQTNTGVRRFYIGARKGPTMILAGTSSGVCVGGDDFVFNNKKYFPIPIVDEETDIAIGFCQGVEMEEYGLTHLEVVSINPSIEAMSTLPAEAFYDGIIGALEEMAAVGDYQQAHLPVDPVVHTNRKALAPVIATRAKKYRSRKIRQVVWNSKYPKYNYSDVYIFWERPFGDKK